jgi:hypothetical protein
MSVFHGASATSSSPSHASAGLSSWQHDSQQHDQTWDAMETYFECITTCSLEDGECITRCVEQLRAT